MSMRFRHTLGDLEGGFIASARDFRATAPRAVKRTSNVGWAKARRLSIRRAGPHGKAFHKRITQERTGPLAYEYGPEGEPKTEFVGVGYRTGGGNLDLPQSSDGLADDLADRLMAVQRETWRL